MDNKDSVSLWEKIERLGTGGNGEVWKAKRNGFVCALKILDKTQVNDESYRRFIDEIKILRQLGNEPGILPILDAHLPASPSKNDRAWLSMPLATGIKKALGERPTIDNVVVAIETIAETLATLAEKDICHRDIKPENLYRCDEQWVIGDFGLADFPEKDDVTEEGRALGPRFYIAPEMVRDPLRASGFPADVWSLAKTMWVLATGQNFPPPHPQLANDPSDALAVQINHPRVRYLDSLIELATSKEATQRPSMRVFANELRSWLAVARTPIPAHDVSDVTNRIRLLSGPFFDTQNRMARSRSEAEAITQQLMLDFKNLYEAMRETGLPCNEPSSNGINLREGSGFAPSDQGDHGVTVSMYTPSPATHIYECGILIQVLDERRHRLYAAHRIRLKDGGLEIVWSEHQEVDSGSSHEHHMLRELMGKLCGNLRIGLERFAQIMS